MSKRVVEKRAKAGRPPKLNVDQIAVLRGLAIEHPNATVEYLRRMLASKASATVSRDTLYKYLSQAGIVRGLRETRTATTRRLEQAKTTAVSRGGAAGVVSKPSYGYTARHRDPGDASRYPSGWRPRSSAWSRR